MGNFITFDFWFNYYATEMLPSSRVVFIALLAILWIGAIISFKLRHRNGLLRRLYGFFSTNAFIGLILWFFNYQMIPFWSARIWLGLWGAGMIWWVLGIWRWRRAALRKQAESKSMPAFDKYQPHPKKRRK